MAKSFRGEGDLMVDALVSASQQAYNMGGTTPMPGFGRDLVPYFDGGETAPVSSKPRPPGARGNVSVQPPPQAASDTAGADILAMLNGYAPAPPTPVAVAGPAPAKKNKKARRPPSEGKKAALPPAPITLTNGFTYEVQQPDATKAAKTKAAKAARLETASDGPPPPTATERWAGGSFQNSPAPDNLPVPAFMMGLGAPTAATPAKASPVDGADIMAMLGQTRLAPAAVPMEASAPDLMAMLNITPQVSVPVVSAPAVAQPPAAAPVARPVPVATAAVPSATFSKSPARGLLLTPAMLAAMAIGGASVDAPSSAAAALDRSAKVLSMRNVPTQQSAGSTEFQSLLRKLESA
jgi:hypothetical protein